MGASPGLATGVSVLVLLLAASNGGPVPVSTASPTVAVSECRTISTPGHYELTADLSAPGPESCVRVLASDVHLDGNGHVLRTSGPTRSLVVVRNASNVTVRNLTTVGATAGVTYWNVSRGRIEAVTATAAGRMGIWVVDSAGVEVVRSRAAGNAVSGIRLDDTTGSSVTGVEATGNAAGVALGRARANEVRDSSLRRNQIGIQLAGATGNTIAANTVEDNEFGMVLAVS
ncbi:MAG: NosD domain-containing protein, partial [Halobacteriales archaeon]|nr:NosD domain-containing protein [Halobacteriales archaeon]